MHKPSGGGSPYNIRETSSLPTETWTYHMESHSRDSITDETDRDSVGAVKRHWISNRSSNMTSLQGVTSGACLNGNAFVPRSKPRFQGHYSGFFAETGRNGSAFAATGPLDTGSVRRVQRNSSPSGTSPTVKSQGFCGSVGVDYRASDTEERHNRNLLPFGDDKEGCDQPLPPHTPHVHSVSLLQHNGEKIRNLGNRNLEYSRRIDRAYGNADLYSSRRRSFVPDFYRGKDLGVGDKSSEVGRLERYGIRSRDGLRGDDEGGYKDTSFSRGWRHEMCNSRVVARHSSSTGGNRNLGGIGGTGSQSVDSAHLSLHASTQSSKQGFDQLSPSKHPRLGWGEGLAKYEKKVDDVSPSVEKIEWRRDEESHSCPTRKQIEKKGVVAQGKLSVLGLEHGCNQLYSDSFIDAHERRAEIEMMNFLIQKHRMRGISGRDASSCALLEDSTRMGGEYGRNPVQDQESHGLVRRFALPVEMDDNIEIKRRVREEDNEELELLGWNPASAVSAEGNESSRNDNDVASVLFRERQFVEKKDQDLTPSAVVEEGDTRQGEIARSFAFVGMSEGILGRVYQNSSLAEPLNNAKHDLCLSYTLTDAETRDVMSSTTTLAECDTGGRKIEATAPFPPTSHLEMIAEDTNVVFPMEAFPEMSSTGSEKHNGRRCHDVDDSLTAAATLLIGGSVVLPVSSPNHKSASEALSNYQYDGPDATDLSSDERPLGESRALEEPGRKYLMEIVIAPKEIVVDDPEPSRFIVREEKTTLSILESVSAVLPTIAHVASSSDSVMSQVREEIVATINSDEVLPEREPACDGSLITEISTVYTSVSEDLNNVKHALLLDSTSQNGMTILETVEKVEAEIDSVKKELAQISEELSGDVGLEITLIHQARVLGLDSPYMREDTTEFLPCSVDARVVYPSSSQSSPTAVYITLEKSSERDHSSTPALLRRESKLTRLPEKDVLELVSEGSQPKSASFENDYDAKYLIGAWSGNISRRLGSEEPKCSANQFCYGVATVGSSPHELNEGRIKSLLMENKEKARLSVVPFEHLLPRSFPGTVDQQSYQSPIQTPVWQHNVEKHKHIHVTLLEKIAERRQFLKFKELVLTLRYRALMEAWRGEQKELSARRNLPKSVGRWDNEGCSDHALSSQRFPLQFRPLSLDGLDADSDAAQAMKMLMKNPHLEALRSALKMPAMFMDDKERVVHRFVSRNALVEDPIALEKERKTLNLWTTEERKVFTEKFAVYNKNFKVIASYLQLKTTADCVEYYYRNKKTEEFEKSSYGLQLKNRWDYTKSSSAFLAPTPSRIERNHEPTCDRIDALNAANMNMNPSQSNSQLEVSERANLSCGYFLMPSNVEMPKFLLEEKKALEVILPFGATTERAMSSLISTPCSVSSTAAHLTDDCKENDSVKKRLTDMPSITRSSYSEQHPAIAKVTRSTHFRRMSSRAATQEDSQWTDAERHLFTSAVAAHGKDFRVIASNVGTKSQSQCKSFFSKTRKRLCLDELVEQFQANEAAAMLVQSLRHYGCLEREVKPLSTSEIDATAGDIVEDLIDTAAAVSTLESFKGHSKCLSIDVSDLTLVADAAAVMEELTLVKPEVPSLDLFLSGKSRTSSHDLAFELVKVNQSNTNVLFTLSRKEEDEDSEATKSDGCYLVGTEAETDIVVDQAAAALIGMSAMLEDKSGLKRTKSEAKLDAKSSPVGVFSLSQSARLPTSSPPLYAVTPENLCLISGGTSRNVIERGNVTIPCKATTMDRPQDLYDAQTSRKFREMAGGESKPRREPTSWTQEEKEKFAIILREHGKDWSLLHDNLPSKSLTQIKTYFQNSKARSRLSASDKHLTVVQNDGANRKRKADEFELTRGSVELASSVKQKFRGNVDFPDLDSVTQKDDSQFGSAPVSGTVSVGIDILSHVVRLGNFAGQPADRASSSICQMVSANTYSQSCIQDGPEVFRPGPKPALPFSEGSRLCTPGSMQQLLSSPGSSRPVSLDPEALSLGVVSLGGPPPAIHKVAQQMQQMLEEQKQLQKQLNLLIQQQAALPPQLLPQHHQVSQQTLQAGRPLEEKLHQVVQQLQQQYELQGQGQIPCQEEGRSYSSHFQHQQTTPRRGILKVKPIRGVVSKPLVDLSTSLSLRDFSNQAKSQNDIIELRQQHHTLSLGIRAIPIVTAGSTAVVQENHTKMVELQDSDFYTDCEVMGSSVMVTEDAHQQTSIVHSTSSGQQQNTTPSTTSTLSSDSEHMKSRDVKLFGQSLLSKPPSVLSSSPCSAESLARDF